MIEYLGYLQESFLLIPIHNITNKFSDREMKKKYYFIDVGILNLFLLGDSGKLLENLIFNELYRKHGENVTYYKRRVESDFYLPDQEIMIQVSFDISDTETQEREIKSLISSMKDLKVNRGLILTHNFTEEELNYNNYRITLIPAWKWLLNLEGKVV